MSYDSRDHYCTCGDPVVPGKRACIGCLLDRQEIESGRPIVQAVDLGNVHDLTDEDIDEMYKEYLSKLLLKEIAKNARKELQG